MYYCKMSIFSIIANVASATRPQGPNSHVKWSKPEPRFTKLNVDASYHADVGAGSTGAILQDFQGRFIAASSSFIPHVATPVMAEAIAMKQGLALARMYQNPSRIRLIRYYRCMYG
jgi:hypothetical protein